MWPSVFIIDFTDFRQSDHLNLIQQNCTNIAPSSYYFDMFGDVEAALSGFATSDAIILGLRDQFSATEAKNKTIIAADDIKTFGAFRLEQYQVTEPIPRLSALAYPVGMSIKPKHCRRYLYLLFPGHVIQCMRCLGLKYGFLSTYKSAVFIRRVADYRFELSLPIDYRTVRPSLPEYFLGFAAIAFNDGTYLEMRGFDSRQVGSKWHLLFLISSIV